MLPRFPLAALVVLALAAPAMAYPAYMATEIQDSNNHVDASRCDWDPLGVYVRGYDSEDCRSLSDTYGHTANGYRRVITRPDINLDLRESSHGTEMIGSSNRVRDQAR